MTKRGRQRIFNHELAKKLRSEGMTITQIACQLGVSWSAVKYAVDMDHQAHQKAKR